MNWMLNNMNAFDDGPGNYESSVAKGPPPFDIGEVTFEGWHFTLNSQKSHCDFSDSHSVTSCDGDRDFGQKALQACRDYIATASTLSTPQVSTPSFSDPFASGADFIPIPQVTMSSSPPVNSNFWNRRQGFSDQFENL
jgi:hypothetical protein